MTKIIFIMKDIIQSFEIVFEHFLLAKKKWSEENIVILLKVSDGKRSKKDDKLHGRVLF